MSMRECGASALPASRVRQRIDSSRRQGSHPLWFSCLRGVGEWDAKKHYLGTDKMQEHLDLANPNPYLVEGSLSRQENVTAIPIRCPHCRIMGNFQSVLWNSASITYPKRSISPGIAVFLCATIRICPNPDCNGLVSTIEWNGKPIRTHPPELIDFDPEDIPENLLTTLVEAISCHAAGAYRATAMMVRRLLEEICEDDLVTGKNLHDRIKEVKNKITLPQELFDAMGELKALGNDAAHVKATTYNTIGIEEAEDSIALAKEILKARYQLKGLVERLKIRKNKNTDQE